MNTLGLNSIIFAMLLCLLVPPSANAKACRDWSNNLSKLQEQGQPLTPKTLAKEASSADVILLGEHHLHRTDTFLEETFIALRNQSPDYDCFFMEIDRNRVDLSPRGARRRDLAIKHGLTPHFVDDIKIPEWMSAWTDVENRNYLYDNRPEEYEALHKRVLDFAIESIVYRDQQMASKIDELIQKGACTRGVGLFGHAHLLNPWDPEGEKTIPYLLKKQGYSLKTYRLKETISTLSGTGLGVPNTHDELLKESYQKTRQCAEPEDLDKISTYFSISNQDSIYNKTLFIPQVKGKELKEKLSNAN